MSIRMWLVIADLRHTVSRSPPYSNWRSSPQAAEGYVRHDRLSAPLCPTLSRTRGILLPSDSFPPLPRLSHRFCPILYDSSLGLQVRASSCEVGWCG